jgi:hypothetical protein
MLNRTILTNLPCQYARDINSKSEYPNPKQTLKKMILKSENPKHRIQRMFVWDLTYSGHLNLFRISCFEFIVVGAFAGFARDTLFTTLLACQTVNRVLDRRSKRPGIDRGITIDLPLDSFEMLHQRPGLHEAALKHRLDIGHIQAMASFDLR